MLDKLKLLPPDSLFGITEEFNVDKRKEKIKLSVSVYQTEDGKPFVLDVIKKTIRDMNIENFNYLPIEGDKSFLDGSRKMIFGNETNTDGLVTQQINGGTHGISLFSDLLFRDGGAKNIIIGIPTWDNHLGIFKNHNIQKINHINQNMDVDFNAYKTAVDEADKESVLVIHGGKTHNPTGKNLSLGQVEELIETINNKKMILFVDFAYIGFGDGVDEDLEWLRFVYKKAERISIAVSFSKNATLYKHRTGVLFFKTESKKNAKVIKSQLKNIVRESISNLSGFGSALLAQIFNDEKKTQKWKKEVDEMRKSINQRRELLVNALPKQFRHIENSRGMFGLLGLTKKQVLKLKTEHAFYIPLNSRITFAGLKIVEIGKIAEKIKKVLD